MQRLSRIVLVALALAFVVGCGRQQFHEDMARARARLEGAQLLDTELGLIQIKVNGEGPALLVIHGAAGGYDQGLVFADSLTDRFQIISVSRFGYLGSPVPANASIELQADLYASALDLLGVESVAVVGLSAGGLSALQFALRYPDRCSHLVMVSALSLPERKPKRLPLALRIVFKSDYRLWRATRSRKKYLKLTGAPPQVINSLTAEQAAWVDRFRETMHPASLRYPGMATESAVGWAPEPYLLDRVTSPTLIFHAKDDGAVDIAHARHMGQRIPGAVVVEYESGGHLLLGHHRDMAARITAHLGQ